MHWKEYLDRFGPEPEQPSPNTGSAPGPSSRWRDEYEERAAIYEFEAGFPRDEAERRAYEDAVTAWLFQSGAQGTIAERRAKAIAALAAAGIRETC